MLWSDPATWPNNQLPVAGSAVDVPQGWDLWLDISPPPLASITIEGSLSFLDTSDLVLNTTYIVVRSSGKFKIGSAAAPFQHKATVLLSGTPTTKQWAISSSVTLSSKVLAATDSAYIGVFGAAVGSRWTRLGAPVAAGATTLTLAQPMAWPVNGTISVTSTTWNPTMTETANIIGVSADNLTLTLDSPLRYAHGCAATTVQGRTASLCAEVALVSSNVLITSLDGQWEYSSAGSQFGCRVVANGPTAAVQLQNAAVTYGGQAGNVLPAVTFTGTAASTGSFVRSSAIVNSMDGGILVQAASGVVLDSNVLIHSRNRDTVRLTSSGNTVSNNLAFGTVKLSTGSIFDQWLPSTYYSSAVNNIFSNVAAGSDRIGFTYVGDQCGAAVTTYNNTAHSLLVGLSLLRTVATTGALCTAVTNFTAWRTWDFGVLASIGGISTDVAMTGVVVAEGKHAGVQVLRQGNTDDPAQVTIAKSAFIGTFTASCTECLSGTELACHPYLSTQRCALAPFSFLVAPLLFLACCFFPQTARTPSQRLN